MYEQIERQLNYNYFYDEIIWNKQNVMHKEVMYILNARRTILARVQFISRKLL